MLQDESISAPARQNLRSLQISLNVVWPRTHSPDGLNNTVLSQGCILGVAVSVGIVGGKYNPGTGEGMRSL